MTVILISVGVSLLDGAEDWRRHTSPVRAALRDHPPEGLITRSTATSAQAASRWLAGALAPATALGHDPVAAETLRDHARDALVHLWPVDMSAELNTFARAPQPGHRLRASDTAVLLCSDTVRGLLAGAWNAMALTGGDATRVRYVDDPRQVLACETGTATVARVPGLDIGNNTGFVTAMRWLGDLAHGLLHRSAAGPDPAVPEPLACHLSGGYKATIPYLIGLAEWLRSAGWNGTVDALVHHEATAGPPVRLPLRQIPAETVRDELGQGWDDHGQRRTRPPGLLAGYAYDYDPDRDVWALTPYGVGLRAVFGRQQPGLGG